MSATDPAGSRAGAAGPDRPLAFLVSTTGCARDIRRHMGSADYSYVFVLDAFRPLLQPLGSCRVLEAAESRLAHSAARAAAEGQRPVHLALQPPQATYFTPALPTVLFPFWEFPDVPDRDFGHDTRQNWARLCRPASLVLTACRFTAEAFRSAGVTAPVEVVPVPLPPEPFATPAWDKDHAWTLECRHFVWGGDDAPESTAPAPPRAEATRRPRGPARLKHALRDRYRRHVRPWLSDEAIERISAAQKAVLGLPETPPPLLPRGPLTLSGLVYTTVFNFSDRRKNAQDLLTAFLLAFRDRSDVTLVLKLATSPAREFFELRELRQLYQGLGLRHRCRVAVVTEFLSDEQMGDLFRATTYYVNASRAEGACLPLQQALAAGRPAIAPAHTAMADYMDDRVGFVVASDPEPTFWPHDPEHRFATTWHRLVWSSLRDGFLRSAAVAASDRAAYDALSAAARERMEGYAGRAVVARALRRALRQLPAANPEAMDWAA